MTAYGLLTPGQVMEMLCKDCVAKVNNDKNEDDELKDLEDVVNTLLDAYDYLLYTWLIDLVRKTKSPYFKLLIKLYERQTSLSMLLRSLK